MAPHRIAQANADWEARAIEACRNDPLVLDGTLCVICMCNLPDCLCVSRSKELGIPQEDYQGEAALALNLPRPSVVAPIARYLSRAWTGRR